MQYLDVTLCSGCGLCAEVCPHRIMQKNDNRNIAFRQDRRQLCMRCGQCMAVCPTQAISVDGLSYSKDFFDLPGKHAEELPFLEMVSSRRAIRNFKDQPVPTSVLEKIVQAIAFAPPSFTPLKTEVVVVQDTATIRKALPEMVKVYDDLLKSMRNPIARFIIRCKVGREKFKTIKNHVIPLMESRLPELKTGEEDTITRHAPAILLFHADKTAENYEADIYIALTYGILAAHSLGLGGSIMDLIPPAIQNNRGLRSLFSIPDDHVVVGAMILGYPKYRYQRGIKRELRSVTLI